jgi:hypothetical protein
MTDERRTLLLERCRAMDGWFSASMILASRAEMVELYSDEPGLDRSMSGGRCRTPYYRWRHNWGHDPNARKGER